MASPNHQVVQMGRYSSHRAKSHSTRLVAPNVALTAVLTMTANRMNLKMSRARSKARRPLANRLTNQTAMSASNVLPTAIPKVLPITMTAVTSCAASGVGFVNRFARNAPKKIPGQKRHPQRSKTAIAMPVGGQTAEALGFTNANYRPNLAAPKYTAAMPRTAATV